MPEDYSSGFLLFGDYLRLPMPQTGGGAGLRAPGGERGDVWERIR